MNLKEVRANAKELLKGYCRICPSCNGKVCAGELPGMGGTATGSAFQENFAALTRKKLNFRSMHDIQTPDTSFTLFGVTLALPVMVAPMGNLAFMTQNVQDEKQIVGAMHAGARQAGSLCWGGDNAVNEYFALILDEVKKHAGIAIPTIKPRKYDVLLARIHECAKAGAIAVAIDIDACCFPSPKGSDFSVHPWHPVALAKLISQSPLPVILKGIMTVDEAKIAADIGASGIVVSNHGGRFLDQTPGTAEVLSSIADAVKGRLVILVDGAIRTGTDVLKMLALGADAVLIGRPMFVAAVGGGAEGVAVQFGDIQKDLARNMVWTGVADVKNVPASILYQGR